MPQSAIKRVYILYKLYNEFICMKSTGQAKTISVMLFSTKLNISQIHCIWAGPWENVSYFICEQQRRRSPQSDQHLCCSLLWLYISRLYSRNFKTLASFCSWACQFESDLVGNSRRHVFSWREAHIYYTLQFSFLSLLLPIQESVHIHVNLTQPINKGVTKL